MRWFRFYSEALDDPKVQLLPPELFKFWVNVLCLANRGDERGVLPSIENIAFRLRMGVEEAQANMAALVAQHLVDIEEGGTRRPHNWERRQHKSDNVTPRVQKHRAKRDEAAAGNVTGNVSGNDDATLPSLARAEADTETEAEPETEADETGADAPAGADVLETAAVLFENGGTFIGDGLPDIQRAVARSFALAKQFLPRDGPLEAEKFCRYFGRKKAPSDWYRAWLNWIKRASAERPAQGKDDGLTDAERFRRKYGHLSNVTMGNR